jgi:alpha-N-arabinofuranosidase
MTLPRAFNWIPLFLFVTFCVGSHLAGAEDQKSDWAEFSSFSYEGHDPVFEKAPPSDTQFYNPILAGFHPDPSICRVGDDYYLINSSFSFFPGVPIYHSTDLVNWTQIGNALDRASTLNLDGSGVSGGIYAPAITYYNGLFYIITTNLSGGGNFYITAANPAGPWSDPVWLPEIKGIDPSLFFDDDGKGYIVHNGPPPDDKPQYKGHRAIWLWEFDPLKKSADHGRIIVNGGTDLSKNPVWIEGPHLFKRNGYYYLSAAQGGTEKNHSQVVFRTKSLSEKFEPFPDNPILTQRGMDATRPDPVTSTGHADMVETQHGEWWAVFLGIRTYEDDLSNIGRETFLLPVTWHDDWPIILKKGEILPHLVKRPNLPSAPPSTRPLTGTVVWRDDFKTTELDKSWLFLRTPRDHWWSLSAKPGSLLIAPRFVALTSVPNKDLKLNGNPSFIAQRLQHADFSASTVLMVNQSMVNCDAGFAALQNDANYFFLGVRTVKGKSPRIFLEQNTKKSKAPEIIASESLPIGLHKIELRIKGAGRLYSFSYRTDPAGAWKTIAEQVDGSILSTQAAGGFVGTVIGLYARTLDLPVVVP